VTGKAPPITHFGECLLRLKQVLGVASDMAVADVLGMSNKALSARKRCGSFPVDKAQALVARGLCTAESIAYVLQSEQLGSEHIATTHKAAYSQATLDGAQLLALAAKLADHPTKARAAYGALLLVEALS